MPVSNVADNTYRYTWALVRAGLVPIGSGLHVNDEMQGCKEWVCGCKKTWCQIPQTYIGSGYLFGYWYSYNTTPTGKSRCQAQHPHIDGNTNKCVDNGSVAIAFQAWCMRKCVLIPGSISNCAATCASPTFTCATQNATELINVFVDLSWDMFEVRNVY